MIIHNYLVKCAETENVPQFGGPWFNVLLKGNSLAVNITRAEAVTMLNRVFYRNNSTSKSNVFNDLNSSHWAYSSIVKAASK